MNLPFVDGMDAKDLNLSPLPHCVNIITSTYYTIHWSLIFAEGFSIPEKECIIQDVPNEIFFSLIRS